MLVRFLGTTSLPSVEVRHGTRITLNMGDVVDIDPESGLLEEHEDLFEVVQYGTTVLQKRTALTPTQVKALNSTPITLVSAPGAGYCVVVDSIVVGVDFVLDYETNKILEFRYTNGSGDKVSQDIEGALDFGSDIVIVSRPTGAELLVVENAPVVVYVPTGNPATGTSLVSITVTYRILPVY